MVTLTPSSDVGNAPLTMELLQSSVLGARPVPWIVTHELATTPGRKLAPFTTDVTTGGDWDGGREQETGDLWYRTIARHAAGRSLGKLARIEMRAAISRDGEATGVDVIVDKHEGCIHRVGPDHAADSSEQPILKRLPGVAAVG